MNLRARPRRTAWLLASSILLASCAGEPMPLEQARSATVIDAAGAKLPGKSIEGWLLAAAQPPNELAVAVLVSAWIDEALLATAIQRGPALDDSATVDAVILPDAIRGTILESWQVYARRSPPTDPQVDSLLELDRVRVFQQLQLRIPNGSDTARVLAIGSRAVALHKRAALPGTDFSALVREASEDSVGRVHDGFLPATTRDQMPPTIAPAIWRLTPGGVSPVLRSGLGFHIFRRASPKESREGVRTWLAPQLGNVARRKFTDSVVGSRGVLLAEDAPRRIRELAGEPVAASEGPPLATWTGGDVPTARARDWVMMLSPVQRAELSDASNSAVIAFLNDLVRQEILFALAAAGGGVTKRARDALAPVYLLSLDSVKAAISKAGNSSSPDPALAATALVDSVVGLAHPFRPLPGNLAGVLRARYSVAVDTAALGVLLRAAQVEWRKRHAADSAAQSPRTP